MQFCYIALGSCAELETQLIISHRRSLIIDDDFNKISEQIDHENRMLMNLIKKLNFSIVDRKSNPERRTTTIGATYVQTNTCIDSRRL